MMKIEIRKEKHIFEHTAIMGILNATPDSFSDGGRYNDISAALLHCESMLSEGADIIDLGGCSTRPNNTIANEEEETKRVLPILKNIRQHFPKAIISIDTFRKSVAQKCIDEGADIINDISGGLFDELMLPYIGQNHIPYVMMHCCGTPETMHQYTLDGDICQTVATFFKRQLAKLSEHGSAQVILDPGIGFGKSLEANYTLLCNIEKYRIGNLPILIGISRKSLINKILETTPDTAENGTTVLNTIALMQGADIIRVHNVKNAVEALRLVEQCEKNSNFAKKKKMELFIT